MWNEPTLEDLAKIPGLYDTEEVPSEDKLIYEHFFILGCNWYIAEFDPSKQIFFGYAILNNDYQNAEWGYIDYIGLKKICIKGFEVERDLHWERKKAKDIEKIVESGGL